MHNHTLENWIHPHDFAPDGSHGQKRTRWAITLTTVMMVVEIVAGVAFGSMALLADGWHMSTHVAAFAITLFAYRYARKHANTGKFTFGPGKVTVLGGFASAIALAGVAIVMAVESVIRIVTPEKIYYNQAILVAVVGLIINAICAVLLHHSPHHHGDAHHDHDHDHDHHDHNLKAAYMHVIADALTSVLAIAGLLTAKYFNWVLMDPLMGIVGAAVITKWAYGLLRQTSPILLDEEVDPTIKEKARQIIERDADNRVADLHIWKVGPNHYGVIVSIVTHYPNEPAHYKNLLTAAGDFSHILVEVNPCNSPPCQPLTPTATQRSTRPPP